MRLTASQTAARIVEARALLAPPPHTPEAPLAVLGAAAFAAFSAVLMAGVVIVGPGVDLSPRGQMIDSAGPRT